jgi:hypothetical protein
MPGDFFAPFQDDDNGLWEAPRLLKADRLEAARTLSQQEARYLCDTYYSLQHSRIQSQNQVLALTESAEPNRMTTYLQQRWHQLERQIQQVLDAYSQGSVLGCWSRAQVGIGPVLAAGLLAYLDAVPPATVGHWWRFAGLDPSSVWEKETKRPWNAKLKVVMWKCGQSFVKCSGREDCLYGYLYKQRKAAEQSRNEQGRYAEQAAAILKAKRIDQTTDAYKHYSEGRLPPGHIQARSERWAVKLFISHYHLVSFFVTHGTMPPKPFAIDRLGHQTYIWPMHTDLVPGLTEVLEQTYGRRTNSH